MHILNVKTGIGQGAFFVFQMFSLFLNEVQAHLSFPLPVWVVSCIDSYSEWSRAKGFMSACSEPGTATFGSGSSVSTAFWCFLSPSPLASSPAAHVTNTLRSALSNHSNATVKITPEIKVLTYLLYVFYQKIKRDSAAPNFNFCLSNSQKLLFIPSLQESGGWSGISSHVLLTLPSVAPLASKCNIWFPHTFALGFNSETLVDSCKKKLIMHFRDAQQASGAQTHSVSSNSIRHTTHDFTVMVFHTWIY